MTGQPTASPRKDARAAVDHHASDSHGSVGLLAGLTEDAHRHLERLVREISVPPRATIFREGDPGDALYIVRSGLVDIVLAGTAGSRRVATIGPGESFGEQSLVSGEPRTATAVAQTGAVLWRLDHADFLHLVAHEPSVSTNVARILSLRLRQADRARRGLPRGQTVVLWSARPRPVAAAARRLVPACTRLLGEAPAILASGPDGWEGAGLPTGAHVFPADDLPGAAVRAVREHALVLILCTPDIPNTLLLGADRVIAFGDGMPVVDPRDRSERVRVLPGKVGAERLDALAREICGKRIGLALGSGGIRGFAHAGVLAVLEDEGIPVDLISGASAGALAGALFLSGMSPREFANIPLAMREAVRTGLPTLSLSPQAILKGRRMLAYLRTQLGADSRIEDLPVPFIVSATDLGTREPLHISTGNLPNALAASTAVPGVFPPVTIDGHRLVDGGVSDPVPVGILRERGADIVIAVNVMSIGKGPMGMYTPRFRVPLPGVIENLLIGFDTVVTQIAVHACRNADVVVEPGAASARWYDVVPARTYMKAGERAMREAIPAVRRLLGDDRKSMGA